MTHEAKATEADGDRHSDGMIRMGTQRKSVFEMFAIDLPSLRGEVAAKKTQPAKRTRADKNSVYSGAPMRKDPSPSPSFHPTPTPNPGPNWPSSQPRPQTKPRPQSLTLTLTRS